MGFAGLLQLLLRNEITKNMTKVLLSIREKLNEQPNLVIRIQSMYMKLQMV